MKADISDAFEEFAYQNIDTAVWTYNTTLADIIDNHVSQMSRIFTVRADKPYGILQNYLKRNDLGVNKNGNTNTQN